MIQSVQCSSLGRPKTTGEDEFAFDDDDEEEGITKESRIFYNHESDHRLEQQQQQQQEGTISTASQVASRTMLVEDKDDDEGEGDTPALTSTRRRRELESRHDDDHEGQQQQQHHHQQQDWKRGTNRKKEELQLAPREEPGALEAAHAASPSLLDSVWTVSPSTATTASTTTTTSSQQDMPPRIGAIHVQHTSQPEQQTLPSSDLATVATPIAEQVPDVEDPSVIVAVPAPTDQPWWWSKPRNCRMLFCIFSAVTVALVVVVATVLLSRGDTSATTTPTQDNPTSATTPAPNPAQTLPPTTPDPMATPASLPGLWKQLGQDIVGEAAGDEFGRSVSLSADGSTVAIGAVHSDSNGVDSGRVQVYMLEGGNWTTAGNDIDGEAAYDETGWSVSLSADGTTVAIGAIGSGGGGSSGSGRVRVYQLSGTTWAKVGNDIDGEALGKFSGRPVSLSVDGTTVAIGAMWDDDNGINSGHVRVFRLDGGIWMQVGSDIHGEAIEDRSGAAVSLSADGTIVAIGAPYNQGNGHWSGHVRVFQLEEDDWAQVGSDIDGEVAGDESGSSISLSADGSTVAIGARYNNGNGDWSGHVRVYRLNGEDWSQVGLDIDGEAAGARSGYSVSLSTDGTTVAMSSMFNINNGVHSGQVEVFQLDESAWIQVGNDIAEDETADDWFGYSVSLSGDGTTVAIGAHRHDGSGKDSGHVLVYRLLLP